MAYPDRDFRSIQRAKQRIIRRRVHTIMTVLTVVLGSIGIATLAWQIFVMP